MKIYNVKRWKSPYTRDTDTPAFYHVNGRSEHAEARLGFDLILSFEHPVDLGKIICPFCEGFRGTFGAVVLLKMSLLSKRTHLGAY